MTNSIVERVARAMMAERISHYKNMKGETWETAPPMIRKDWMASARAAILAMRLEHVRDNEIGAAGANYMFPEYTGDAAGAQVMLDAWNIMIDKALDAALPKDEE